MSAAVFIGFFSHLVAAILCAAAGMIVWDVGTRSPARVFADLLHGVRNPKGFVAGLVRFVCGLVFVALSAALLLFAIPADEANHFTIYPIVALLAGLAVELLIGDYVRPYLGLGTRPPDRACLKKVR